MNLKLLSKRVYLNNRIISLLLTFFGINWYQLNYLLNLHGIQSNILIKNLPLELFNLISISINLNFYIDKILFKMYRSRIRFKKKIGTYRGLRLKFGLPSRGQRTHSNAKTAKKYLH